MNNDYDRGESPRYTMTNFNKDMSPIDISDPVPTVKLLLLESGETVISVVSESICGTKLTLQNPRTVFIQSSEENNTTVLFGDWMPLASTRSFDIRMDYVVTLTDPLDSLVESYLENNNG